MRCLCFAAAAAGARWAISRWTSVLPTRRCSCRTSVVARGLDRLIARWPRGELERVVLALRARLTDVLGRVRVGTDRDCRMPQPSSGVILLNRRKYAFGSATLSRARAVLL